MGGWVFHEKIDFNRKTPHLQVELKQPKWMIDG